MYIITKGTWALDSLSGQECSLLGPRAAADLCLDNLETSSNVSVTFESWLGIYSGAGEVHDKCI